MSGEKIKKITMKNKELKNEKTSKPKKTKFVLDVSWVFISSIVTFAVGFIIRIILGNKFGPEGLGLYAMVLVFQVFAVTIGGIGLNSAIVKYAAEFKDNKKKLRSFISAGLYNSIILGLVVSLIIYIFSGTFAVFFNMPMLLELLKIIAFIFPSLMIYNFCLGVANGLRNMKKYAYIIFIEKSMMISFTVGLIFLGFGIDGAIWAIVISIILTSLFQIYLIKSYLSFPIQNFNKNSRTLFIFGSQLVLAGMAFMINSKTDMLMIGYFLSETELGIYAVAIMLISAFYMIPNAVQKITYPAFSEYYSKKDFKSMEKMINKSIKYIFLLLSVMGIILILFGNKLISFLFPSDVAFSNATLPLIILVIGGIVWGTMVSIGGIFSGIGKPLIALKIIIAITIINIILNGLFIPIYGISGAALATAISFIAYALIVLYLITKMLNINIETKWAIQSIPMIAITILFYVMFNENMYFYIISIILSVLYCLYLYIILLTKNDKIEIKNVVMGILKR